MGDSDRQRPEQGATPAIAADATDGAQAASTASPWQRLVQQKRARRAVQRRENAQNQGTDQVHTAAEQGVQGGAGALPHGEAIQRSFGRHDVSGVEAHVGGAAAKAADSMGAAAYATGNHVAFAGAPDLHTAAHEAAHVVQQRGGVQLKGGVGDAGDGYERHADEVADRVVRGESAEALLDQRAGGSSAATGRAVQHVKVTWGMREIDTQELTREELERLLNEVRFRERGMEVQFALQEALEKADYKLPRSDEQVGRAINDKMDAVNGAGSATTGVWYEHTYKAAHADHWTDAYLGGFAPAVFTRTAAMDWILNPNNSASAAIQSWLAGLTIAECASTLVAIHIDALRQQLGNAKFDQCFGSADGTAPTCQRLRINANHGDCIPAKLLRGAGTDVGGPSLRLGAKYYFKNHDNYIYRHPDGAFRGENAVYLGSHPVNGPMWTGLGVGHVSTPQMFQTLLGAYNKDRTPEDHQAILLSPDTRVPRETVLSERAKGKPARILYDAWKTSDVFNPYFIQGEQTLDLGTLIMSQGGAGISGQGVMLNLREVEKLLHE